MFQNTKSDALEGNLLLIKELEILFAIVIVYFVIKIINFFSEAEKINRKYRIKFFYKKLHFREN